MICKRCQEGTHDHDKTHKGRWTECPYLPVPGDVYTDCACDWRGTDTNPESNLVTVITKVLADHRRLQNTRSCSGCDWLATAPGRNGDPATMHARHDQFNEHLAAHIVAALTRPANPGDTL